MVSSIAIVTIVLSTAAAILLGWVAAIAMQHRHRPNGPAFAVTLGMVTMWAVVATGARLASVTATQTLVGAFEAVGLVLAFLTSGAWTVYVLGYASRDTGLTRRRILLISGLTLPVLLIGTLAVVTVTQPPESLRDPLAIMLILFIFLTLLYPLALLVYAAYVLFQLSRTHALLSKQQILILLAAITAPYIGLATNFETLASPGFAAGLFISGMLFAGAIRWYPLLSKFPASESVARRRVVKALQEAVVVVNWEGYVIDVNETTTTVLGRPAESLIGSALTSVIDDIQATDLSAGSTGLVSLETTQGRRQFQYSVSGVGAADNGTTGSGDRGTRAIVFRDVTDQQTQQERLAVLNRILRHNVRNRLDIVLAHAEHIPDETSRMQVRDSARELIELSTKAREAEKVMQASTDPPEQIDVVAVVEDTVEQHRTETSAAKIVLDCPETLLISSHPDVITQLLSELVENALSHTEQSTPHVEITVRPYDEATVEIIIADNGPGIPDREKAVLADGAETQLQHGRGVGLWFVKWAVTQLGGELLLDDNDPTGSIVTVRIRDTEAVAHDVPDETAADSVASGENSHNIR